MSAIFILIAASLIISLGFLAAFIWSVKSGQYDDDYTPSVRMLFEDTISDKKPRVNKTPSIDTKINLSLCNSKNSPTTTKL